MIICLLRLNIKSLCSLGSDSAHFTILFLFVCFIISCSSSLSFFPKYEHNQTAMFTKKKQNKPVFLRLVLFFRAYLQFWIHINWFCSIEFFKLHECSVSLMDWSISKKIKFSVFLMYSHLCTVDSIASFLFFHLYTCLINLKNTRVHFSCSKDESIVQFLF
jgi:hypothetical protein